MADALQPGAAFAGHRIDRLIGSGGMGQVYLAEEPGSGRHVALKLLPAELAGDVRFRARFERESRLAASLSTRTWCRCTARATRTARCGCRSASSTGPT